MGLFDLFKKSKGIDAKLFETPQFQKDILEYAKKKETDYWKNHMLVHQRLMFEGLNIEQADIVLAKLRKLNKRENEELEQNIASIPEQLTNSERSFRKHVEFSFSLPIGDLFHEIWDANPQIPDGKEIAAVCELLQIKIDREKIEQDYWAGTNNLEVFHGVDPECFAYFDLLIDPTDQCNMIFLGIRCRLEQEIPIRDMLMVLYRKSGPRSNFTIDYYNGTLYGEVFNPAFYFYRKEQNKRRRINYHNLKEIST